MCAAVGHPVRRLHRSRYAGLGVQGLGPGEWRELDACRGRAAPLGQLIRRRSGRDEADALVGERERLRGDRVRLVGALGEDATELLGIGAQLVVAPADRVEQRDDSLGHVRLELPVALAVVACLDSLGRFSERRREDVDEVRDAGLVEGAHDLPTGVCDRRAQLLANDVRRVEHPEDASVGVGGGRHPVRRLLDVRRAPR